MHANTHTTMALPTRRDNRNRRAPSRPDICQAACRPESRTRPGACEPRGTDPRPACARPCALNQPKSMPTGQPTPPQTQGTKTAQPNPTTRTTATTAPSAATPTSAATPANTAAPANPAIPANTVEPWSPGSNRSRWPITAGPSHRTDERPQPAKRRPSPHPRPEDEWSPSRMLRPAKPSWGRQFASRMRGESGMSTAEYAVGTLAAVAFAGVLLKVVTSGPVQSALADLIERALS